MPFPLAGANIGAHHSPLDAAEGSAPTRRPRLRPRTLLLFLALAAVAAAAWLATTEHPSIWPVRNVAHYRLVTGWWSLAGGPGRPGNGSGSLSGIVVDDRGRPVPGARVLVTAWNGTARDGATGRDGAYRIVGIPPGSYAAVAGAPGYADTVLARAGAWAALRRAGSLRIADGRETVLDATLRPAAPPPPASPGRDLRLGTPEVVESTVPIPGRAVRRPVSFVSAGRPNQRTLYYLPDELPERGQAPGAPIAPPAGVQLPLLITIYPGPADAWEEASVPLAAAGFAVLAAGPAYSFDLERDVDEIERLVQFARDGKLPSVDGRRIAVLGGSYSALHVQLLARRDARRAEADRTGRHIQATALLGAPADLFDMRRGLEDGIFIPPFGLDRALIALGFPDRAPLRYWRYSATFHAWPALPPVLLVHSRADAIVPYQQSEIYARALSEARVPHELHLLEGGSHYLLSEPAGATAIQAITLRFLATHLRS